MNESMKKRGCCMTCNGDKEKKGRLVKRTVPKNAVTAGSTSISTTGTVATSDTDSTNPVSGNISGSCIPSLKGVSL
jgi:hypothetical protein